MIHENTVAPLPPLARINLAITGHREGNAAFAANRGHVEQVLGEVLDIISSNRVTRAASIELAPTRLHSMLSEGVDLMAAEHALARGWELVAPLAFGLDLNVDINALPTTAADALTMIAGGDPADPLVKHRADSIRGMAARARLFELTDRDQQMAELLVAGLQEPIDRRKADTFAAECSLRVELAAQVMLAHADLLIAVWTASRAPSSAARARPCNSRSRSARRWCGPTRPRRTAGAFS